VIQPTHHQHLSEELPCQQPVSEDDSSSGEPPDGSKEQSNDDRSAGVDIKSQEHQVIALSESHISESGCVFECRNDLLSYITLHRLIPRDLSEELTHHQTVSNGNPSLDGTSDGSEEQVSDLEKEAGVERNWGPQVDIQVDIALESGVAGQVFCRRSDSTRTMPLRDHDGRETFTNQAPPEGDTHPRFVRPILIEGCFNRICETFRQVWGTRLYCKTTGSREVRYSSNFFGSYLSTKFRERDAEILRNPEEILGPATVSRGAVTNLCSCHLQVLIPMLHASSHPINLKEEARANRRGH
jgi:hypothetical protein